MKYKDADFSKWDQVPQEDVFTDWVAMRKEKRAKTTQTAINRTAKWVNLFYQQGYDVDTALSIACELGWQGLEHVYSQEQRKGFPEGRNRLVQGQNIVQHKPRSTRELTTTELVTDRSWAD